MTGLRPHFPKYLKLKQLQKTAEVRRSHTNLFLPFPLKQLKNLQERGAFPMSRGKDIIMSEDNEENLNRPC